MRIETDAFIERQQPEDDLWRKQAVRKGGVLKCPDAIAEGYGWTDEVLPAEMVNWVNE